MCKGDLEALVPHGALGVGDRARATQLTLYKKEMMIDAILSVSLVANFF